MTETALHDDLAARRTAVTWVTGTGAFLLLVAAGVFVGVNWDHIPPPVKLGVLCALTGGFLLVGHTIRRTLPSTGSALFHLGALLVPMDVGAVTAHTGGGWQAVLLAVGITGTLVFPVLARVSPSTVLDWAWTAAVVALAGGAGAASDVPAGVALAVAAVATDLGGLRRPAVVWAMVAGFSPLLASTSPELLGSGVLHDLGITGDAPRVVAAITGGLAAFVLGREARRRTDAAYALLAMLAAGVGLATTWLSAPHGGGDHAAAAAAVFLAIELAALLLRRDVVWRRPLAGTADIAEAAAMVGVFCAAVTVAFTPVADDSWFGIDPEPVVALTYGLLAVGWLAADLRRRVDDATPVGLQLLLGGGWAPATVGTAMCAVASVAWATGSSLASAAAMLGVAGLFLLSGRPLGHVTGAVFAVWAPVAASAEGPWIGLAAALTGAAIVAGMAATRARIASPIVRPATALAAPALAFAALIAVALGAFPLGEARGPLAGLLALVGGAWLVAAIVDPADRGLANAVRFAGLSALLGGFEMPVEEVAQLAAALTLLAVLDAVRLNDPAVAWASAVTVPVTIGATLVVEGATLAYTGVGLCVAAVVASGLAAVVEEPRWRWPFVATAATSTVTGVTLAFTDPRAFGDALLIAGGLVLLAGLVTRRTLVSHAGGITLTLGLWVHLATSAVVVSEAYLAPIAAQLVLAGMQVRGQRSTSSWMAYGPPIAMLGGAAFAERLAGGPAWHGLVAGTVGVAAVAAGGYRRLAAPLLLGTVLCVAVAGYESLAVTATVPTWGWLALGGAALLGAGVAMERHDTTPIETGRRLVDVVSERFA